MISFARGVPSPDILPVEELAECARAIIASEGRTVLNYGPAGGYPPLREWIGMRHGVPPEQVVITPGSLMGLNFVARHVFRHGGRAIVEAPSYDRMHRILRALGVDVEEVPLSKDGLDLDFLAALLKRSPAPRLIYTMPTFHNPTGRSLSLSQRRHLVDLAREHGVLICEDDPYGLIRFEGEALPSLHELAHEKGSGGEWAIFSSSFSKTVAPGLRVGYLILPKRLVVAVEDLAAASYVSPPILPQAELFEFVRRGWFEPNLGRVRTILRSRHDAMIATLETHFPPGAEWSRPGGGYFLWLQLPEGVQSESLLARALENGVSFVKGSDFYAGAGGESAARLSFSFPSIDQIRDGIQRLAAWVREIAPTPLVSG